MSDSSGNHRKRNVDYRTGEYKTCLIHAPRHTTDECKVLGDFGSKYFISRPTKDPEHDPVPRNKCNDQQENSAIVNIEFYEILLH